MQQIRAAAPPIKLRMDRTLGRGKRPFGFHGEGDGAAPCRTGVLGGNGCVTSMSSTAVIVACSGAVGWRQCDDIQAWLECAKPYSLSIRCTP